MKICLIKAVILLNLFVCSVNSQVIGFPYRESFDSVTAPIIPDNWSLHGFAISSSTPRSIPNCISTTGDMSTKRIITPFFDFSNRVPDKLFFWERRSSTALKYRLEIRASTDGINYDILLAVFDTINSTSNYVQRIVNLSAFNLQDEPLVKFEIRLVDNKNNNTGVLRIDDFSVTMATAYDIGLKSIEIIPANPSRGDQFTITALANNYGLKPVPGFAIYFYIDKNYNDLLEAEELFCLMDNLFLSTSDSLWYSTTCPPQNPGIYKIFAVVNASADENRMNDTIKTEIYIRCEAGDVVINEIMYAPLENQTEWVELYNKSVYPINISGWRISDRPTISGVNSYVISNTNALLYPNCFAVIGADSSIYDLFSNLLSVDSNICVRILNRSNGMSFNNDGDAIVLKDQLGTTIDSLEYSPNWHNPNFQDTRGRSLERISPSIYSNDSRNWSTCTKVIGGTPGAINSISILPNTSLNHTNILRISPNPFSPDGDGFEDFCVMHYELPMMFAVLSVRIYDIKGRLIRNLVNGEIVTARGEIIWNGLDDNRQPIRIGTYIVYLEAVENPIGKRVSAKSVVVLAAKI